MSAADQEEVAHVARSHAVDQADTLPKADTIHEKEDQGFTIEQIVDTEPHANDEGESLNKVYPTEEEFHTLRRVAGEMPWMALTVAFVELCERFSYYGTTAVCMFIHLTSTREVTDLAVVNFIQRPLPDGSKTGAITGTKSNVPGALNMGQRASTGLTLCKSIAIVPA